MFEFAVKVGLADLFEHFRYLHVLLSYHVIVIVIIVTTSSKSVKRRVTACRQTQHGLINLLLYSPWQASGDFGGKKNGDARYDLDTD
jgi:hypothetical protein